MKTCKVCLQEKALEAFHRLASSTDGRQARCKVCVSLYMKDRHRQQADSIRAAVKAWTKDHPDQVRSAKRAWKKTPKGKAAAKRYNQGAARRMAEKVQARFAVAYALQKGRLKREPCRTCGTTERVEAHHEDYSKALLVTWLCGPCHRREHAGSAA